MFSKTATLLTSAFALCALSAPLPDYPVNGSGSNVTAANVEAFAPKSVSCSSAAYPDECADSTQAAAAINKSFNKYKVTTTGEKAALVAYMAFESGDFQFKKNHFPAPGRPGQGTRMMAMPPFVKKYATSLVGADAVVKAEAAGGDAGLNAVLAIANTDDETSFGSAAWFLTTECSQPIREGLAAETTDGWHAFLTECVGTTTEGRDKSWLAAKQALHGNEYKISI